MGFILTNKKATQNDQFVIKSSLNAMLKLVIIYYIG